MIICCLPSTKYFYPRPPRGGRPYVRLYETRKENDFYPRPPRGGRPPVLAIDRSTVKFLSTPSARRATLVVLFIK